MLINVNACFSTENRLEDVGERKPLISAYPDLTERGFQVAIFLEEIFLEEIVLSVDVELKLSS